MAMASNSACLEQWQAFVKEGNHIENKKSFESMTVTQINKAVTESDHQMLINSGHSPPKKGPKVTEKKRFCNWAEGVHGLFIHKQPGLTIRPQMLRKLAEQYGLRLLKCLEDAGFVDEADLDKLDYVARIMLYDLSKNKIETDALKLFSEFRALKIDSHVFDLIVLGVTTTECTYLRPAERLWGRQMAQHMREVATKQFKSDSEHTHMAYTNGNTSMVLNLTLLKNYCLFADSLADSWRKSEIVQRVGRFHSEVSGQPVTGTCMEYGFLVSTPDTKQGLVHVDFVSSKWDPDDVHGDSLCRLTRVVALTEQKNESSGPTEFYVSTNNCTTVLQTILKHGGDVQDSGNEQYRPEQLEVGGKIRILLHEGQEAVWSHNLKHSISDRAQFVDDGADNSVRILLFHSIQFDIGKMAADYEDPSDPVTKWPISKPKDLIQPHLQPYLYDDRKVFIRTVAQIRELERAVLPTIEEVMMRTDTWVGPSGLLGLDRDFRLPSWPVLPIEVKVKKSSSDKEEEDDEKGCDF